MAGDVAHHQADRTGAQRNDVVPIAADLGAGPTWDVACGEPDTRQVRQRLGKQALLQRLGDTAFPRRHGRDGPAEADQEQGEAEQPHERRQGGGGDPPAGYPLVTPGAALRCVGLGTESGRDRCLRLLELDEHFRESAELAARRIRVAVGEGGEGLGRRDVAQLHRPETP